MTEMTIFFADVASSVELYENFGDIKAHQMVQESLKTMAQSIMNNHGRVIETIGDEVMAAFANPDFAYSAASSIQDSIQADMHLPLSVRIGFHTGPTAVDRGHPFGDTVNVAARMVAVAKAGQILLSQQSYMRLSASNRQQTRHYHRILLKGKNAPTDIYELLWDDMESTKTYSQLHPQVPHRQTTRGVRITFNNRDIDVTEFNPEITAGRSEHCTICVDSDVVSRQHVTFAYQQGKVVVSDQSTNGTFIRTSSGKRATDSLDFFIHHEDWIMQSSGILSLGEPISDAYEKFLHFRCF